MIPVPRNVSRLLIESLKMNAYLLLIDLILLPIVSVVLGVRVSITIVRDYLSLILFIESGVVLIVGGMIAMSSSLSASKLREHVLRSEERWSPEEYMKGSSRANRYILASVFLFIEALMASILSA